MPTFFIACLLLLCVAPLAYAQTGLPPGCRLSTEEEANAAESSGIIAGVTYVCPGEDKLGISNVVGAAKKYLLSIAEGLPGTKAPPDADHIAKLNNTFAVCAANFFQAYTNATGVPLKVRSAYRDGPSGENAAAGGAPGSNHTRGLAIDVNPADGNYPRLWKFASDDPRYGVCFPHLGGDRPHVILAGIGGNEAAMCASQGVTKPCSGAPGFDPKMTQPSYTGPVAGRFPTGTSFPTGGTNARTNPFANPYNPTQLASLLNSPPPPSEFSAPTQPSVPTSGTVDIGGSVPTGGGQILPTIPAPSTPSTPSIPAPKLPSLPDKPTSTVSIFDKLVLIGGGSSSSTGGSVSTSTSSPVQLNDNLKDIGITKTGGTNVSEILSGTLATGSLAVNTVHVTDTFSGQQQTQLAIATSQPKTEPTISQPLLLSILTTIRDYLILVRDRLLYGNSSGFQAAWKPHSNDGHY